MASRWTTSGIDWADIGASRTEHVVDELYIAMKEREALFKYLISQSGSSVASWDIRYPMRHEQKVSIIMETLQTWLTSDYTSYNPRTTTHQHLCWHDYTATHSAQTVDYTKPYNGMTWLNSDASGNLETELGISLARIRGFGDNISYRIDLDLLEMIYAVLQALKEVYIVKWKVSGFALSGEVMPNMSSSAMEADGEEWEGSGADYATALSDYNTDTPSTVVQTFQLRQGEIVSHETGTYSIIHNKGKLINNTTNGLKSSGNTAKTFTDYNVKMVTHNKDVGDVAWGGSLTLDTFSSDTSHVSNELLNSNYSHPHSVPNAGTGNEAHVYNYFTPWGTIDANGIIEYYTP